MAIVVLVLVPMLKNKDGGSLGLVFLRPRLFSHGGSL